MDVPSGKTPPPLTFFEIIVLGFSCIAFVASLAAYLPWIAGFSDQYGKIIHHYQFLFGAVFLVDFFVELWRAPNRKTYLRWGWINLATAIPAWPIMQFGRLFRIIQITRKLSELHQQQGVILFLFSNKAKLSLVVVFLIFAVTLVGCTLAVLRFESGVEGANIHTNAEALWWAIVTVTTVGYGDYYPVTDGGRIIAVILMIVGIGTFSTFTASIGSMLVSEKHLQEPEMLKKLVNGVQNRGERSDGWTDQR